MTKKELLKQLENFDDETEIVILSSNGIQVSTIEKVQGAKNNRVYIVESK